MSKQQAPAQPKCICEGSPEMQYLAFTRTGFFYECQNYSRLLYRSKVATVQQWYLPEAGGTFCLVTVKEMDCQTCQGEQLHIRYVGGPWLCLKCRVRESAKSLKKEGK